MKAVVCQHATRSVVDAPEPEPAKGHVRLEVVRCGICGSDLHARHGIDDWAEQSERAGYDRFGRSHEPLVFGHEFSGRVAEYGPGCNQEFEPASRSSRFPSSARTAASTRSGSHFTRPAPTPSSCSSRSR